MNKREETKSKIILSTIECIEKFGIKDTTTRNISQLAGVNVSAISYYFQGRENLINIVYEKTLENAFSLDDISIDKNDEYKTVLRKILKDSKILNTDISIVIKMKKVVGDSNGNVMFLNT